MEIYLSDEFTRQYKRLPQDVKKKLSKQQALLCADIYHPSLHTEKLSPKDKGVWSFRIDLHYRVLFRFLKGDTIILLTVGTHAWVYHRI